LNSFLKNLGANVILFFDKQEKNIFLQANGADFTDFRRFFKSKNLASFENPRGLFTALSLLICNKLRAFFMNNVG